MTLRDEIRKAITSEITADGKTLQWMWQGKIADAFADRILDLVRGRFEEIHEIINCGFTKTFTNLEPVVCYNPYNIIKIRQLCAIDEPEPECKFDAKEYWEAYIKCWQSQPRRTVKQIHEEVDGMFQEPEKKEAEELSQGEQCRECKFENVCWVMKGKCSEFIDAKQAMDEELKNNIRNILLRLLGDLTTDDFHKRIKEIVEPEVIEIINLIKENQPK